MLTMSVALGIIHSAMREVRRQLPAEVKMDDFVGAAADD